jgi:hypothetical protein
MWFSRKKSSMARSSSFSAVDAEDFQGLKLSNISWKHWTEITSDDQHLVQVIKNTMVGGTGMKPDIQGKLKFWNLKIPERSWKIE